MQTTTEAMPVMELKTFVSDRPETAEKNLNQWLEVNRVEVTHIGQSQSERNGNFVFVLSIFYRRF